jgi:hypothetical protein
MDNFSRVSNINLLLELVFSLEQFNQLPAFADLSAVYGSSERQAEQLRDSRDRTMLKAKQTPRQGTMLPNNLDENFRGDDLTLKRFTVSFVFANTRDYYL